MESSASSGSRLLLFSRSLDGDRLDRDLVLSLVADDDASSLALAFLESGLRGLSVVIPADFYQKWIRPLMYCLG